MIKKTLSKGVAYLKRNGMRGFCMRLVRKAMLSRPVNYKKWLKSRQASRQELALQRQNLFKYPVTFGIYIIEDAGEKNFMNQTLRSLKSQSYDRYMIMEKKDTGVDYLLILTAGTVLEPDALYRFAEAIQCHTAVEFVYGDYDYYEKNGSGTEQPQCTPEFDLYYLRSRNYIGNMFMCSQSLAAKADLVQALQAQEGIYSCLLRCAEEAEKVVRIPKILSHQHLSDPNRRKDMEYLKHHYDRLGLGAKVMDTKMDGTYFAEFDYEEQPLLSVIIPNKDYPQQLEECIRSILELGGYENLEILIVENNSTEKETFFCYEKLQELDSRIRVEKWEEGFHYSRINNDAAEKARGKYLLFLNNDTKIKSRDCLKVLMNIGRQDDVGAVGARLYYADDTIQHAGVILGYGGVAGHALEGVGRAHYETYPFALAVRQLSAVTAACMLVKKKAFLEAGGFSDELQIAYNDIDLCMKMRKNGWKILYCPHAELYHYESQTRGLEMTREKAQRVRREQDIFLRDWKQELDLGDPFYSPNLTLEKADFSLKR